jgi:hypothetical protein
MDGGKAESRGRTFIFAIFALAARPPVLFAALTTANCRDMAFDSLEQQQQHIHRSKICSFM